MLNGKVAVVTGATRGIGRAIVKSLCREGVCVSGIYKSDRVAVQGFEKELSALGYKFAFFQGSVSDREFVASVMKETAEIFAPVDILINNAGISRDGFLMQMSEEEWEDVFITNYLGTFNCILEALPYMLAKGSGKVINMASVSGILGKEGQTNYSASKGAIIGLTRLYSRHYAHRGISFNAVAPGLIETEMISSMDDSKKAAVLNVTNRKQLGSPEEIAAAVLFLAGEESSFCEGMVLRADGGLLR